MTRAEAEDRAKAIWGGRSHVQTFAPGRLGPGGQTHAVGYIALGAFFHVRGRGKSWEEAFSDVTSATVQLRRED